MDAKERVKIALARKQPDRVPKAEIMIHPILVSKLTGIPLGWSNVYVDWRHKRLDNEEFDAECKARELLDMDIAWTTYLEPYTKLKKEGQHSVLKDVWGKTYKIIPQSCDIVPPISNEEDLDNYCMPKVGDFDFFNIKKWVRWAAERNLYVVAHHSIGFSTMVQLTGFENYMIFMYSCPEKLHMLTERFVRLHTDLIRKSIETGADCIALGDDFAHNNDLFMSPQQLWEFDFQYMKRLVTEIHDLGVPVILHACGNVNKALPMLVKVGIDGLQGLQPTAHNDIAAIKQRYGDRLCLMGNMDLNYLLPKACPRKVMDQVRKTIEVAGKGGGYILSTCNMLNSDVPPENALAMYMAGARYGNYV